MFLFLLPHHILLHWPPPGFLLKLFVLELKLPFAPMVVFLPGQIELVSEALNWEHYLGEGGIKALKSLHHALFAGGKEAPKMWVKSHLSRADDAKEFMDMQTNFISIVLNTV